MINAELTPIGKLENSINAAKAAIENTKSVTRKKKYEQSVTIFTKAKEKGDSIIKALNDTPCPTDPDKKCAEVWFADVDLKTLSIDQIKAKITENGGEIKNFGNQSITIEQLQADDKKVRRSSFVDPMKDLADDIGHGKTISKVLGFSLLGLGIGDVLTKSISNLLVKKEIISQSYSLFGLAKYGLSFVPDLLSKFGTFASGLISANPWTFTLFASAAAIGVIPLIVRLVKKISDKHKVNVNVKENYNKALSEAATYSI